MRFDIQEIERWFDMNDDYTCFLNGLNPETNGQ